MWSSLQVNIAKEYGQSLGLSIRGGLEHGLGIYISMVERRSVAQGYGLAVSCQLLLTGHVHGQIKLRVTFAKV